MTSMDMMEALRMARVALVEQHDLRHMVLRSGPVAGEMYGACPEASKAAEAYNLIAAHHAAMAETV